MPNHTCKRYGGTLIPDAAQLYEKGKELYNQKQYSEAAKWHRKAAAQGNEVPRLVGGIG